jgi:hypothetical protein
MNLPLGSRDAVLTLALGKPFYFRLACNLARSFRLWHQGNHIRFVLITDLRESLPADLSWCELVQIDPGRYGKAFKPKLSLDLMVTADRTLFIDADCLVYEGLDRMFTQFSGRPVATVGTEIRDGHWFGDVAALCRQLGVPSIPKFNGGLYYIERGDVATSVYRCARELAERYDELGLVRLRGHPNDELVMASAMSLHGLGAFPDDGSFMSDPQACPGALEVNVLTGHRRLRNPLPPSPHHRAWYPFASVSPRIVHFLDDHALRYPYRTEAARLALGAGRKPPWFANLVAIASVGFPGWAQAAIKQRLRPYFHRVFGARPIRRTFRDQAP